MSRTPRQPIPFARQPAARGAFWLAEAFRMFNAYRAPWILLLAMYYALTLLVQVIPVIGPIAWILLKPVFTVGFLAAAWAQERGGQPKPAHLFKGFQSNLAALMPLGIVFVLGLLLAIYASTLVDGGKLVGLVTGSEALTEELFAGGQLQAAMLFSAACAVPVLLALWFAPALVVFNDAGTVTAIVTSLRACLTNWQPVLVYGMFVFAFTVLVPAVFGAVVRLLPESLANIVTILGVVPYLAVFMATLQISDYVSYRDLFHADESPVAGDGPDRLPR